VVFLKDRQNVFFYANVMQTTLLASQLDVPEQDKNIFKCIEQVPDDLKGRKTQLFHDFE